MKAAVGCLVLVVAHQAGARAATAQIPTVDPDGTLAEPAAPPPSAQPAPAPAEPTIITIGPDGKPVPPAQVEDPSSFYYQDDYQGPQDSRSRDGPSTIGSGPVP